MAKFVLDVISKLSGNESLAKCLKLCEIEDFSELINIDEKTLDKMELYLQKKCARMPLSERCNFIGSNFAKNPNIFKFSPGTRQKVLSIMNNLNKIFSNPNLSVSTLNVKEMCYRLITSNKQLITTVPRTTLKSVMSTENLSAEFVNNFPDPPTVDVVVPLIADISQNVVNNKPSLESFPNIFQRMDLLRKGEIKSNEKDIHSLKGKVNNFSSKKNEHSITNKENINEMQIASPVRSQRLLHKRKVDIEDDSHEPVKKKPYECRKPKKNSSKKVSNRNYSTSQDSSKASSIEIFNIAPSRSRSQRLLNKNNNSEPTEGSIKSNLPIEETNKIINLEQTKNVYSFTDASKLEQNMLNIESKHGKKVKRKYTKRVKINPLEILTSKIRENSQSNSSLKTSKSTASEAVKVDFNLQKSTKQKYAGTSRVRSPIETTSITNIKGNFQDFPKKSTDMNDSGRANIDLAPAKVSSESKMISLNTTIPENPIENFQVKPSNINSTENMKISISQESSDKIPIPFKKLSPTKNLVNGNISKIAANNKDQCAKISSPASDVSKPKVSSGLKLSDVPFQCFEMNSYKKLPSNKIRQVSAPTKISNIVIPKISVKPVKPGEDQQHFNVNNNKNNLNPVKVIQMAKKKPLSHVIQPSKEKFIDQINPIKSTSTSRFRFEPVSTEKLIQTPSIISSVDLQGTPVKVNNFQQIMNASLELTMKPQWTSTPNFLTNRFINSTKHQKQDNASKESLSLDNKQFFRKSQPEIGNVFNTFKH